MPAIRHRVLGGLAAIVLLAGAAAGLRGEDPAPTPPVLDQPLIAGWSFDELFGSTCGDASGHGHHASPEHPGAAGLQRVPGLFGTAMAFSGNHRLRVPGKPEFGELPALSFSVWVLPTDLSGYREIFRKEDGDQRVLFSFQQDGTVLSLGLNVGGYVECDAPRLTHTGAGRALAPLCRHLRRLRQCASTSTERRSARCAARHGERRRAGVRAPRLVRRRRVLPGRDGRTADLRRGAEPGGDRSAARERPGGDGGACQGGSWRRATARAPLLAHWTANEGALAPEVADASGGPPWQCGRRRRRRASGASMATPSTWRAPTRWQQPAGEIETLPALTFSAWCARWSSAGSARSSVRRMASGASSSPSRRTARSSLGLNIDGYVECDAPLDPTRVLDGEWHHCAATFDGQTMRVYLDGEEIGSLARPASSPAAGHPAFLGSNNGLRSTSRGPG